MRSWVAAVLLGAALAGQEETRATGAEPPRYEVPSRLRRLVIGRELVFAPRAPGRVGLELSADPERRRLNLWWFMTADPDQLFRPESLQVLALPYVPTAILAGDPFTFYLGGTNEVGTTVIEAVELGEPEVSAWAIGDAKIESRRVLFESPYASGRRHVLHLLVNMADPERLFFELDEPRGIHALDVGTGESHLVASAVPAAGQLVVPGLALDQMLVYSRDHGRHGYVYFFVPELQPNTTTVIRDLDRDGTLDDVLLVPDEAAWHALGLGATSEYRD